VPRKSLEKSSNPKLIFQKSPKGGNLALILLSIGKDFFKLPEDLADSTE